MIPAAFDYLAPTSVDEALAALAEAGDDAKVLAGGQSPPAHPADAAQRTGDDRRPRPDRGAARHPRGRRPRRHRRDDALQRRRRRPARPRSTPPCSRRRSSTVADPQVRHRGTVGGALVHADPAGDVGAAVLALEAELVIRGPGGERTVPATEFFRDLFETAVEEGELLTAVRIPKHTDWVSHYEKFVRVSHQWAIVAVAAALKVDGGTISRGPHRADEHGLDPAAGRTVEAALQGRSAVGHRRRLRGRRGGHEPAERPQRRRRLPAPPGDGPHPTCRQRRPRFLQHGFLLRAVDGQTPKGVTVP